MESREMLNINDILKVRESNPEPKEVSEVRELITDAFKELQFIEDGHKYYIKRGRKKVELPSVSSVIERWTPFIDWDEKAEEKAIRIGTTKEALLKAWHENKIISTSCGSKTHFFGENAMNMFIGRQELAKKNMPFQYTDDGYLIPYCPKEWAVTKYYLDILKNPNVYPVMPEARLYTNYNDKFNLKTEYAGTFDILMGYKLPNEIAFAIHDFKGLPLDTKILTTNGFKTMGELSVGDMVYDRDGNPVKIKSTSQIHYKPCIEFTFDDKTTIVSDHEHRWMVSFLKRDKSFNERVMTSEEIHNYLIDIDKCGRNTSNIPKIRVNKPLNNKEKRLPIDPYVLGAWLGDGGSKAGYITNMYDELFAEIERRGYHVGENVGKSGHCGKAKTRCVFGLWPKLKELGIWGEKDIPDIFLTNSSYNQRLDILKGLMDTDGTYNKARNRYVISTTKRNQVSFTVKLLASLGIKPSVSQYKAKCNDCKKEFYGAWNVSFITDEYPFLIRDIKVDGTRNGRYSYRNIVSAKYVETVPTRCIEVDSPSHTYLATEKLIVTHNTNADIYKDFSRKFKTMMLEPFGSMGFYEEAFSHYCIQLSLYQIGLMQLGIKIVDRQLIWLKDDGTYEKVRTPDLTDTLLQLMR